MTPPSAPAAALSEADFKIIRTTLDRIAAIQINEGQEYLVENRLRPLLATFGLASYNELAASLDRNRDLKAALIDAMTTNETLFFRDAHPFETIAEALLPALAERRSSEPITIWCAACSSGQEPYSLAMLIRERFPELTTSRRLKIFATDLSTTMIERCKSGTYSEFEVSRGLPAPMLAENFDKVGSNWVVKPATKSLLQFEEHNLMGSWSSIPKADIVLMRNVLIYFTPEVKTRLLGQLRKQVLRPGGALFLGASETTINLDDNYVRQQHGRSTYYENPAE